MDSGIRYCYSWDGERYYGTYSSEDEALKEAREGALRDEVYIGTCVEPELKWGCIAEVVISQIEDNLYDDVGEMAADFFEVGTEDEAELDRRLDAVIAAWIRDRNIKPDCYKVSDGHRVPIGGD